MIGRWEAVNNSRITLGYYATVVCCGRVVGDSALHLLVCGLPIVQVG